VICVLSCTWAARIFPGAASAPSSRRGLVGGARTGCGYGAAAAAAAADCFTPALRAVCRRCLDDLAPPRAEFAWAERALHYRQQWSSRSELIFGEHARKRPESLCTIGGRHLGRRFAERRRGTGDGASLVCAGVPVSHLRRRGVASY
jgi:hypothetical protein